jgi:AcrR family transcriptional regulator
VPKPSSEDHDSLSLTQRRIRATRLELAHAALDVVAARGWDAVDVPSLAASVGVSARTFYRYFPSKRDVFGPLLSEAGARSRSRLVPTPDSNDPELYADALVAGVLSIAPEPADAQLAYRILLSTPDLVPVWLDEAQDFEEKLRRFVAPLTGDAASSGASIAGASIDGRMLAAAVIFGCLRVAVQTWAGGDDPTALRSLAIESLSRALEPGSTRSRDHSIPR